MRVLRLIPDLSREFERLLDELMWGRVELWQLPLALQSFYKAGWVERDYAARRSAAEYERQLDILWMQALTPKERQAEYRRRMDEHFRREDEAFFAADSVTVQWPFQSPRVFEGVEQQWTRSGQRGRLSA